MTVHLFLLSLPFAQLLQSPPVLPLACSSVCRTNTGLKLPNITTSQAVKQSTLMQLLTLLRAEEASVQGLFSSQRLMLQWLMA